MTLELKIPLVGESITEVEVGEWFKKEGDYVNKDENVVALESEKATVELPAPLAGTLVKILKQKGEKALVGEVIGSIDPAQAVKEEPRKEAPETPKAEEKKIEPARRPEPEPLRMEEKRERVLAKSRPMPAAQRAPAEEMRGSQAPEAIPGREEEVVRMTPLRRSVAERLVQAQQTMAMLTTFNEIDMTAVKQVRKDFQDGFTKRYGVKLGFMSFFIKAVIDGLRQFPQINASIRDQDIIYHNYFDIGLAVASNKGLAVPVLRNADKLSFADTEKAVADFSERAQSNKLKPDELQGGTFTITNGGVFGSLLSTPIVNPPQSAILGMHAIQDRPVALEGNVVVRPMMFVALSYDHRLVDGREAVLFLKRVKEVIENPTRMLIEA